MSSTATTLAAGDVRRDAATAELHPESLLRIPLVRQAFCDLNFRLIERSVDPNWTYSGVIPISMTGFNPFECAYYYGRNSLFELWLSDPFSSARELNENDLLVKEVLFMAHDYLHSWAYQTIEHLFPEIGVLDGAITDDTFEDYAFCHLVTEAVATVGLDYWFLSERGVNDYCSIGTNMGPLTVSYREARLPEYRRAQPSLQVQTPEFFRLIAKFYCTGEFPGFDGGDLRRSPQLFAWLSHELSYGATQRKLTRQWLSYIADQPIRMPNELTEPIPVTTPFRRTLLDELGQLLWIKVKGSGSDNPAPLPRSLKAHARRASLGKAPDFRFLNLARADMDDWRRISGSGAKESLQFFLHQHLAGTPYASMPPELVKLIPRVLQQQDAELTIALLRDLPRFEPSPEEPRDLFLAN